MTDNHQVWEERDELYSFVYSTVELYYDVERLWSASKNRVDNISPEEAITTETIERWNQQCKLYQIYIEVVLKKPKHRMETEIEFIDFIHDKVAEKLTDIEVRSKSIDTLIEEAFGDWRDKQ